MARTTGLLTALKVERAKRPGMYADGGGLYLQVTDGGRSWIYRYTLAGKTREMGLGPLALYGLAEARALTLDARRLRHQGIDPIDHRRAARAQKQLDDAKAMTFRQCADAYIATQRAGWRSAKHAGQWETTLATYARPVIGALPVQAIDTPLVLKVLQQHVEAERGEPAGQFWQARSETAARLRGRIEAVLDWAKVRGYRIGENPARWRGHLDKLLPARSRLGRVRHHPALPYRELPGFMADLRSREGISARALEFAIVTAGRAGEVIGARWSEFDLFDKTWTVPADRMKAGKPHRVPLSPRALAILQEMQLRPASDNDALVFPGSKPGRTLSKTAIMELLQRMGREDITAHGFRSTFRDWAAESTNYPNHVVEQALAHTIGSRVEAAYRRSDLFEKRRRLMQQWATFCTAPAQEPQNNVAALRQRS
jgi:integrase